MPRALRVLRFRTTWVGAPDEGVPLKGSTDAELVAFAQRTNQVIVTSNHDMMTLCDEAGQRFVWLDPRGRTLTYEAQVLLVFSQIASWEQILSEQEHVCVCMLVVQHVSRYRAPRLRDSLGIGCGRSSGASGGASAAIDPTTPPWTSANDELQPVGAEAVELLQRAA